MRKMLFWTKYIMISCLVDEWKARHPTVLCLGVPEYIGSGNHTNSSTHYRFMVMQRFGKDLEKIFTECGRQFTLPTVCYLALRVVSMLCKCFDKATGIYTF